MGENAFQDLGCEEMSILITTSRKVLIDDVVDLEAGIDIFKIRIVELPTNRSETSSPKREAKVNSVAGELSSSAGKSLDSSEEKNSERWQEGDDSQLCCIGNVSKGCNMSGVDEDKRDIGEEAIMGQKEIDVSFGNIQKQYEYVGANTGRKKKYSSLQRIQENFGGTQRKNRNCRVKKHQRKVQSGEEPTEIEGMSLSNSDLQERWQRQKKEAKKTLQLGRELGLQFKGAEETKKEDIKDVEINRFWCDDEFDFKFSKAMGRSGGKYALDDLICSIVNVYAPCEVSEQIPLWNAIVEARRKNNNKWFMAGDFNAIRNLSERSGCSYKQTQIAAFNDFIEEYNLVDMPLSWRKFTWFGSANRKNRLDMILVEDEWFQVNSDVSLLGLLRTVSDHIPILLGKETIDWGPRPFKLVNSWLKQESCTEVIKKVFQQEEARNEELSVNLRRVKGEFKRWNTQCYWNVDSEAKKLEKRINELDMKGDIKGLNDGERGELEANFSIEEVKEIVWSCGEAKAPEPDGFNIEFFKKSWEYIKGDLMKTMESFNTSGKMGKSVNSSFLALIPKVENPTKISDYRPISLVSSVYKVIAKVLARRLRRVIGTVISETQCAFIVGRQIFVGILVANEVIHSLNKERGGRGGLILKLDFVKAYDCVDWEFLDSVQKCMGFGCKWRRWIWECISTVRVSVLLNGSPKKEFKMHREVVQKGYIEGIDNVAPTSSISHLQFVDDTILFLRLDQRGVKIEENNLNQLALLCGCSVSTLPFKYLGIPLGADSRKISTWDPLIEKFRVKLVDWKSRMLSFARRVRSRDGDLLSKEGHYGGKWMSGDSFRWIVGDGKTTLFWEDVWLGEIALRSRYPRLYRELALVEIIKREVDKVTLNPSVADRIVWVHENDGLFKVKKLSELLLSDGNFEVEEGLHCQMLKLYALGVGMLKRMRTICLCHVFLCTAFGMLFAGGGIFQMRAFAGVRLEGLTDLDEKCWWDRPAKSATMYQASKIVWQPPVSGQMRFNVHESDSKVVLNWAQNFYVRPWRIPNMEDYLAKMGSSRKTMFKESW
ncbi:hypothetical protein F3Y22_tig00110430pilonHSYRG00099 [Hibiscus syriacus]|uniref:Uncharacterized protein n=1 Tax=Hibiscus syriacus TaxID=106335 RepID=A0A6A3ALT3_HIBSY|nr:hypothetical protein F3Y22_tig00110430pilonHSYRG00099 [Hibiscus syriacus]